MGVVSYVSYAADDVPGVRDSPWRGSALARISGRTSRAEFEEQSTPHGTGLEPVDVSEQ